MDFNYKANKKIIAGNNLVINTITTQAADLGNAVRDLIQNCIDAKSTRVDIFLTEKELIVEDNGLGISVPFHKLGESYKDKEKDSLGKFGTGSKKIGNFGKTIWYTAPAKGTRIIAYHTATMGDSLYDSWENNEFPIIPIKKGTLVKCKFDKNLTNEVLNTTINDINLNAAAIQELFKIKFTFNSHKVPDYDYMERIETSEAIFLLQPEPSSVGIYNQGLLVRRILNAGVSGLIITKESLKVNNERNAILSSCKLWKTVKRQYNSTVLKILTRVNMLEPIQKSVLLDLAIDLDLDLSLIENVLLIPTSHGTYTSISEIKKSRVVFVPKGNIYAQYGNKLGFSCLLDNFQTKNLIGKLKCNITSFYEFKELAIKAGITGHTEMPFSEFRAKYSKKTRKNFAFAHAYFDYVLNERRSLRVGKSEGKDGWTNGRHTIWINITALEGLTQAALIPRMNHLLIHEISHDTDSRESMNHSDSFYYSYHERVAKCLIKASEFSDMFYRRTNSWIKDRMDLVLGMYNLE